MRFNCFILITLIFFAENGKCGASFANEQRFSRSSMTPFSSYHCLLLFVVEYDLTRRLLPFPFRLIKMTWNVIWISENVMKTSKAFNLLQYLESRRQHTTPTRFVSFSLSLALALSFYLSLVHKKIDFKNMYPSIPRAPNGLFYKLRR